MSRRVNTALGRLGLIALACFQQPLWAATFVVNNTADVADASPGDGFCETATGNGLCTLRAAIQEANRNAGRNTVTLPAGFYQISVPPDPAVFKEAAGGFNVSAIDIIGVGPAVTIIDGGGLDTVMFVNSGSVGASIANLTIQNGRKTTGLPASFAGGGGITNGAGVLLLRNVLVQDNFGDFGAGIVNISGVVLIESSTIRGNTSRVSGAGISNSGRLTIRNSTISDNQVVEDPANTGTSMGGGISWGSLVPGRAFVHFKRMSCGGRARGWRLHDGREHVQYRSLWLCSGR